MVSISGHALCSRALRQESIYVLVHEAPRTMLEDQGRLSTLEPRLHMAVLPLALVTATGCLAVAGGCTTAFPDTLVVGPLIVAKIR